MFRIRIFPRFLGIILESINLLLLCDVLIDSHSCGGQITTAKSFSVVICLLHSCLPRAIVFQLMFWDHKCKIQSLSWHSAKFQSSCYHMTLTPTQWIRVRNKQISWSKVRQIFDLEPNIRNIFFDQRVFWLKNGFDEIFRSSLL